MSFFHRLPTIDLTDEVMKKRRAKFEIIENAAKIVMDKHISLKDDFQNVLIEYVLTQGTTNPSELWSFIIFIPKWQIQQFDQFQRGNHQTHRWHQATASALAHLREIPDFFRTIFGSFQVRIEDKVEGVEYLPWKMIIIFCSAMDPSRNECVQAYVILKKKYGKKIASLPKALAPTRTKSTDTAAKEQKKDIDEL